MARLLIKPLPPKSTIRIVTSERVFPPKPNSLSQLNKLLESRMEGKLGSITLRTMDQGLGPLHLYPVIFTHSTNR